MKALSRRTLLRGAGGVAVALPFLDAMLSPRQALGAVGAPRRLLNVFTENGVVRENWFPTGTTKNFTPPLSLQPLEPWKSNLILFDGIDTVCGGSNAGGGHQRGKTGCFTAQPNDNGRAAGISIDQLIANTIGTTTRYKSIEASVFLNGTLRDGVFFSGPGQVVIPEDSPAQLFSRLFSAPLPSSKPDPAADAAFARQRARKTSILDHTLEEYKRISAAVGADDRSRLDVHVEAIRSVERGLGATASSDASASCMKPAAPTGTAFADTGKAQMDLLSLALACDLTRVASLQWRSSLVSFSWINVNSQHHGLSHQTGSPGPDAGLSKIVQWFSSQTAYLIGRLKSFSDAGGTTLLDNTLLYWPNELATGNHHHERSPFLIATGAFKLPSGKPLETQRFLTYPAGTYHSGLLTVIGQAMGLELNNFGAVDWQKGPLPGVL
jgi:hypothetical protein